jgi:hypothetical protein
MIYTEWCWRLLLQWLINTCFGGFGCLVTLVRALLSMLVPAKKNMFTMRKSGSRILQWGFIFIPKHHPNLLSGVSAAVVGDKSKANELAKASACLQNASAYKVSRDSPVGLATLCPAYQLPVVAETSTHRKKPTIITDANIDRLLAVLSLCAKLSGWRDNDFAEVDAEGL